MDDTGRIAVIGGDPLTRRGCLHILGGLGTIIAIDSLEDAEAKAEQLIAASPQWALYIGWHYNTSTLCTRLAADLANPPHSILLCPNANDISDATIREAQRLKFYGLLVTTVQELDALRSLIAIEGPNPVENVVRLSRPLAQRIASLDSASPTVDWPSEVGMDARHLEIMKLLAEGKSNKEIALQLGRSEALVKLRVKEVMRSLGMRNRTQVAAYFLRQSAAQGSTPSKHHH